MKPIEELLKNLGRAEVLEFGLVTNRLPSVNIGGKFEPVDDEAPTTDVLLQMLVTMGGSRYVEQLSERPVQWTTRLDGVGVIAVAAIMRKDIVQARFTVARRDTSMSKAPPGPGAPQPSGAPPAAAPAQQAAANAVAAAAAAVVAQQSRPGAGAAGGPGAELRRTQLGTGGPQPNQPPSAGAVQAAPGKAGAPSAGAQPVAAASGVAGAAGQSSGGQKAAPVATQSQPHTKAAAQQTQAMPVPGSSAASSGASPAAPPVAPGSSPSAAAPGPLAGAVPPPDDWDDDDEPTVQTLSPPVAPPQHQQAQAHQAAQAQQAQQAGPGEDPKPKPARKPGEVPSLSPGATAQPSTAQEEKAAEDRKAAEERLVAERKAADERKAAEERAAHERKIIEERAAAERKAADDRKAAEERKLAEQRNVAERAVQERVAAERAAVEKRGAIERAAADRAAQAERAAIERKAAERAKVERRISTPTSVDAVDVEITTSDSGTRPVSGTGTGTGTGAGELELDPIDNTVELTAPPNAAVAQQMLSRATAPIASAAVPSAIPSTTPSAANVAEKDRPRPDGALVSFLAMAVSARATDIHIVAGRPLLIRVATDLLPRTQPVEAEHVERIVREIVPVRLRETLDTDGACDFAIDHAQHGRFRVHVSRQRTGFKLSMRVIPREIPTLATLALPEGVGAAAKYGQGLVLVTGPASHGKTSTLAAIVDILNRDSARHVLTVEDPVEYIHPRKRGLISQREIGGHTRSWGSAMKAALREDPDVIVIGELRDAETTRLAIEASETGHLVIATMSTPSAAKTVDRVIDLFPPAEQPQIRTSVANALRLIIGQRLVPSADRTRLHAAVELLPSSIALYTLIRDARTFQIPSLQQRGRAQGVVRLDESLAELVRAQKVTLEVAKQFAESAEQLEAQATRSVPAASGAAARKG